MTAMYYDTTPIAKVLYDTYAIIDSATPFLGLPDTPCYSDFVSMVKANVAPNNITLDCTTYDYCVSTSVPCSDFEYLL